MDKREQAIRAIRTGDVFHGEFDAGPTVTCIATAITSETIRARSLITQHVIEFSQTTGIGHSPPAKATCRIDSVAALPQAMLDVLLALDHRYSTSVDIKDAKLTRAEIDAIVQEAEFYRNHPI